MKLAKLQEDEICEQIKEQYTLEKVVDDLWSLSHSRTVAITKMRPVTTSIWSSYHRELECIYWTNKKAEDELLAKYKEKQAKSEAQTDDKKKAAAKKKGKDGPPTIGFGKGTRQLFEYIQHLEKECGDDV